MLLATMCMAAISDFAYQQCSMPSIGPGQPRPGKTKSLRMSKGWRGFDAGTAFDASGAAPWTRAARRAEAGGFRHLQSGQSRRTIERGPGKTAPRDIVKSGTVPGLVVD